MKNIEVDELAKADKPRPILSIIIPTYNRQECVASVIRCALAISSNDIEVIVQDCSDDDRLLKLIVPELFDKRLFYRYEWPAKMAENWNRAIGRATGEYICIIGDDDGINPEIVQAAAWAKSKSLDCLIVKNVVEYRWPDTRKYSTLLSTFLQKPLPGSLLIYPFRGDITNGIDAEAELQKLFHDGGAYFMHFNLPKLYYGLVHRRSLEAVHKKVGTYCKGMSPDIFTSLAIACTVPRMAMTDYPLTIPGACRASNSIIHLEDSKRQPNKLKAMPEHRRDGYLWAELVPQLYTIPPIWADSAIKAVHAMGRADLVQQLNLPRLAAYCVRANRGVTKPVLQNLFKGLQITNKNIAIGAIRFVWNVLGIAALLQTDRIKRLLMMTVGKGRQRIDGLNNMVETSQALTRYLNQNGRSFTQCALNDSRLQAGKGSCLGSENTL
jgi:hypothetical protein